jgi:aminopeptidase Y
MNRILSLVAVSSLVAASAVQHPLHDSSNSQELINNKPLISSDALQSHIKSDNLLKRAKELFKIAELGIDEYNHPTRVIGSEGKLYGVLHSCTSVANSKRCTGHLATLDYIYSTIASLGDYYALSIQTFSAVVGNVFESRLVLGDDQPDSAKPMSLTPPTKNKDAVFGPLILVANDGCHKSDYPSNTIGSIALIRRGTCSFGDKSAAAGKAGAIAAVIFNNAKGNFGGTLGEPSEHHVATFAISADDALPYTKDLQNGKTIHSSAYIDAIVRRTDTTNIIAQTKGGDPDNCIMLGGHSDSVSEGPGINDDGT